MDSVNIDIQQILNFYNSGAEIDRLKKGAGIIEWERTQEIISRYIKSDKQVIYDIGGGIGRYSRWLASLGNEVHLFDLSSYMVNYVKELDIKENLFSTIEVGDARTINKPEGSADIVLLMGPLYHLTERSERLKALNESARLLKEGGLIIVSAISRFGSTLKGLSGYGTKYNSMEDDEFLEMIFNELSTGQHIPPNKYPNFITRAFFHTIDELENEINSSALKHVKTLSVEGPIWIIPDLEQRWANDKNRERLLNICRKVEEERSLAGMSLHLIAVAQKVSQQS